MSRAFMVVAVVLVAAGTSACHPAERYSVTSLTSVPISSEALAPDARIVTTPSTEAPVCTPPVALTPSDDASSTSMPTTPSTGATSGAPTAPSGSVSRPRPRAPLVSPGLDNTVTGGVANTGAPFNCGYGNNGNIIWE